MHAYIIATACIYKILIHSHMIAGYIPRGGGGRDEGQFFVKFEAGKEGRMGPRPHDLFSGNLISEFKKFEFIKRCVDPDPLHDTLSI